MTERTGMARACPRSRAGTTESIGASRLANLMDFAQDRFQFRLQLIERKFDRRWARSDQHQTRWERVSQVGLAHDRSESPAQSIPYDGRTQCASGRVRDRHRVGFWIGRTGAPQGRTTDSLAVTSEHFERSTVTNPSDQADRRARPRARRFLMTARPPRVLIRERNPCFFALLWVLG
jgi:hypothetical protein